jgi:hypothetical protein
VPLPGRRAVLCRLAERGPSLSAGVCLWRRIAGRDRLGATAYNDLTRKETSLRGRASCPGPGADCGARREALQLAAFDQHVTISRHSCALSQESCEGIAGLHSTTGGTRPVVATADVDFARGDLADNDWPDRWRRLGASLRADL